MERREIDLMDTSICSCRAMQCRAVLCSVVPCCVVGVSRIEGWAGSCLVVVSRVAEAPGLG